ncbi:hypothetical protein CDAR_554551 [Caerostris darwini]|uniref:Uncharacterized protein n=1 Tax=Caerostris darwini TaxID=1538125 RepID=A0AAV4TE23_9ARAC|nr:hypothetical protein CDAR_554551 [Caerostris darwini]
MLQGKRVMRSSRPEEKENRPSEEEQMDLRKNKKDRRLLLMITTNKIEGEITDPSYYIHHINPLPNPLRLKIRATYPTHTTVISCPSLALPSRSFDSGIFRLTGQES